jgi:iron complex outermembrane receptor protein
MISVPRLMTGAAVACLLLAGPVLAAEGDAAGGDEGDTAFTVGEVVVTANRTVSTAVATSVDRLSPSVIERQSVDNSWELFGRLPGVVLTDFNQGTTSGRFSFRAFNGEGEINAVKLLIDGVPSNTNDGGMTFLDMIFPLQIASAETVRGTTDARYGLFNIAGDAEVSTRDSGRYLDARLGHGGWNATDLQLAAGLEGERFRQNYFVGARVADGYRDHSRSERQALSGRWGVSLADGKASLSALARYSHAEADEPGYLTRADAAASPRRSYAVSATDGGERDLAQAAIAYEGALPLGLSGEARLFASRYDDVRFVRFSAGTSQQERAGQEAQWGAMGHLAWQVPEAWPIDFALEAGADLLVQDVRSQRYLTFERTRQSQTRDQAYDLTSRGGYLQATFEPLSGLKIMPAYRVDWIDGDYHDRRSGVRAPAYDYGAIGQPKISLLWTIREDVTLFGSWGRTFQVGVGSGAYRIPPKLAQLDPSTNDGWELGVKYDPPGRLLARAAIWEQTATGEVKRKLNDPLGDSENLGGTRRRGLDMQLSFALTPKLTAWAAYGWQEAVIVTPDPAVPLARGKTIDHVPGNLFSGGLDWTATDRLTLALSVKAQDSYYLEQTNRTGRFGDYALADLDAVYKLTSKVDIQLQVKNLTDGDHEYVWWDGGQSLHSPGDGRSVHAAVMVRF